MSLIGISSACLRVVVAGVPQESKGTSFQYANEGIEYSMMIFLEGAAACISGKEGDDGP